MRRLGIMIGGGGAAAAAFLLLIGPVNWSAADDPSGSPTDTPTSASPSPTDDPSDDPSDDPTEKACDERSATQAYLSEQGFGRKDYVIGSKVDWQKVPYVNDAGAFSSPLRTQAALTRFLDAGTPQSDAARSLMGDGDADFVMVQFRTPVSYEGNWYWLDDRAKQGGRELSRAGDIWWLNVDADCSIDPSGSIRAVCGNVGLDWIRPAAKVD